MNAKFAFLSSLLIVLFSTQISLANEPAAMLARKAVSENTLESAAAIEELRSLGPAGLEALIAEHADDINRHITDPKSGSGPEWQRITKALDQVGQQKNNFISGLYWYTNLDDAKKAARESGKPILSLRLLGKLTDELSCANSRFFRTVLYANAQVAPAMRDHFILHWQSVRPVPVITIDFGDGRKLERTITGNSIHYVLDSNGQLLDALPGLYGPAAFLRGLADAETLFKSVAGKSGRDSEVALISHHQVRFNNIALAWAKDTSAIGAQLPQGWALVKDAINGREALTIAPLAVTKMSTEGAFLRAMTSTSETLGRITDEEKWKKIAQLHASDGKLDERSIALIRYQNPSISTGEIAAMVKKFEELVTLDTVRNEYALHTRLYGWLTQLWVNKNLDNFNEHVYATLFLTPSSDPWLGLMSRDVYTAIDKNGVVKP